MPEPAQDQITNLLQQMRRGDSDARSRLVSLVYPYLKKIAAQQMRGERRDHTLQPTALVHEAFLKLAGCRQLEWQSRTHFFALSAELMRQILVDYARRRRAAKRAGGETRVEFEQWQARFEERPEMVLEVDRLLIRLSALNQRQAHVVEMRYFGGLTEEEIAAALGVSDRTVKRDWQMARAWMLKELSQP